MVVTMRSRDTFLVGRVEGCTLKGSVAVRLASTKQTSKHRVVIGGKEVQVGGLKLQGMSPKKPGGESCIHVIGDWGVVTSIEITKAGKGVKKGIFYRVSQKTMRLPVTAKAGDEVEVELECWSDIQETRLPFEIVVGARQK